MTDREMFEQWLEEQGIAEKNVSTRWEDDKLVYLNCSGTGVTSIPAFPNLTKLYCSACASLTIIDAPSLTWLYCSYCTNLVIIDAPSITELWCSYCTDLTIIDAPSLTWLYCSYCTSLATTNDTRYSAEIGSRRAITLYSRNIDRIVCGCWHGTLAEFEDRINSVYSSGRYHDEYMAFIEQCKNRQTKEIKK